MGDKRARRGCCLRQLKQLGLRVQHGVRAKAHWSARPHSYCQYDDIEAIVNNLSQALRSTHFCFFTSQSL